MTATDRVPAGFASLWDSYPWPSAPPTPDAPVVGRNSSGFDALRRVVTRLDRDPVVVLEIGAEFGGSTRRFLSIPSTFVVSVDPWPDGYKGGSFPKLAPFLGSPGAMYNLFLTYNFDLRHRLATVRAGSPQGAVVAYDAGVVPDLVYIDGDHRYDRVLRDITVAAALFPDAVLAGDDWLLESTDKKYEHISPPVQLAVRRWATVNRAAVEVEGNTWILDPSRPHNLDRVTPNFGDDLTSVSSRLAALEKSVKRLDASVRYAPSRRIARRVRQTLSGSVVLSGHRNTE